MFSEKSFDIKNVIFDSYQSHPVCLAPPGLHLIPPPLAVKLSYVSVEWIWIFMMLNPVIFKCQFQTPAISIELEAETRLVFSTTTKASLFQISHRESSQIFSCTFLLGTFYIKRKKFDSPHIENFLIRSSPDEWSIIVNCIFDG